MDREEIMEELVQSHGRRFFDALEHCEPVDYFKEVSGLTDDLSYELYGYMVEKVRAKLG